MRDRATESKQGKTTAIFARARSLLSTVVVGLVLLSAGKYCLAGRLLINYTPSIPRGVYWISHGEVPRRGELVAFPIPDSVRQLLHERRYVPASVQLLAKPVVAVGGDYVCIRDEGLVINGELAGKVVPFDAEGRSLPRANVCRYLAWDEIFTGTTHDNSFDSRYFGPVPLEKVRGSLTPLLSF